MANIDPIGMIGHYKVPTQKLYKTLQNRSDGIEILLKFKNLPVDRDNIFKSFMTLNSDLVLFTACLSNQRATFTSVLRTPQ